MLALPLLSACWWGEEPGAISPELGPETVAQRGPSQVPPPPLLGAPELETPPGIARMTDAVESLPRRRLEVRFDADHGTFASMRTLLESWSFTVEDGDGELLRVLAPEGAYWAERLEPLPEIARVAVAVEQDPLPTGELRTARASFGAVALSVTHRPGDPASVQADGPPLAEVELPAALPTAVAACLGPLRDQLADGYLRGPRWERAIDTSVAAWALVVDGYGPCEARGWIAMRADAPIDALAVAGGRAAEAAPAALLAAAARYLGTPRARDDEGAVTAQSLLRAAEDDALVAAIPRLAAEAQGEAWEELARRDEEAAIALATEAASAPLLARAAVHDDAVRTRLQRDSTTPTEVLLALLPSWRPSPSDPPGFAERLAAHADPVVRSRAAAATIAARAESCAARLPSVATAGPEALASLYAECPGPEVRAAIFERRGGQDRSAAARAGAATALQPETVETGIVAVAELVALGARDELLAVAASIDTPREVRRAALSELRREWPSPAVDALVSRHGSWLGLDAPSEVAVATP